MPSTRPSSAKTKASSDFLFSEDIENLSTLLDEQESLNPSDAKPKKTTKSKKSSRDKAPSTPNQPDPSSSVVNLILLETLRKENLSTELKIAEAKLELVKLSANASPVAAAPPPVSPLKLETVITPSSMPVASVQQFATLDQLRAKKKASPSLPNNYLFSAKESAKSLLDYALQLQSHTFQESTKWNMTTQLNTYILFGYYYHLSPFPVSKQSFLAYLAFLSQSLSCSHSVINYINILKHVN